MTWAKDTWRQLAEKANEELKTRFGLKPEDAGYRERVNELQRAFQNDAQTTQATIDAGLKPPQTDPAPQGQALSSQLQSGSDQGLDRHIRGIGAGISFRGDKIDQDISKLDRQTGLLDRSADRGVERSLRATQPLLQGWQSFDLAQQGNVADLARHGIDQYYGDRDKRAAEAMELNKEGSFDKVLGLIQSLAPLASLFIS